MCREQPKHWTKLKMENTSGHGKSATVPPEIDGWNWGAFLLNWIWGIGNRCFVGLLTFVPLVGIVMPFVLGFKGNAWAWRNKRWQSVEQFKRVQRLWTVWSLALGVAMIALFAGFAYFAFTAVKNSEPYVRGVSLALTNAEAVAVLGNPITASLPKGEFEEYGPTGKAGFSFGVEGAKASGTVYVSATKELGIWKLNQVELAVDGRESRIDLVGRRLAVPSAADGSAATVRSSSNASSGVVAQIETAHPAAIDKASVAAAVPTATPDTPPEATATSTPEQAGDQMLAPLASAPGTENISATTPTKKHARARSARDADARNCLDLADNAAIARCARGYR
jgi:hypothetical protein